jgi:hypothetical protein
MDMRFDLASDSPLLAPYIPRFLTLIGTQQWYKRVNQLDLEQQRSPFLWKIVSDYHWLEMAISNQAEVLAKEGRLLSELMDPLTAAAMYFAGAIVEIYARLPEAARIQLQGRLRDGLNAESGFAALYLEADLALRLMAEGYDVRFSDLEGAADYDIEFSRDGFVGEVECKSLSVDAGRRIHRKDFYRFMEALAPAIQAHAALERPEILVITLGCRLSANTSVQEELRAACHFMLGVDAPKIIARDGFQIQRHPYYDRLSGAPLNDPHAFYRFCEAEFGPNSHIAGGLAGKGGCLVVMRSKQGDDTSQPWLEAMRKAASQLSGKRAGFIALQFQDIAAPDLMLPYLRRRAGVLAYALFGHYGADHVNATYVSGFAATVMRNGRLGAPAFVVPNPAPKFPLSSYQAPPFLVHISDMEFAEAIGAPLPAPNISNLPL